MREKIYFWLSVINCSLFSYVLSYSLAFSEENKFWLLLWIIISCFLLSLMIYSLSKKNKWSIIYNLVIWIITPIIFFYQQTLSSIILIIFFSLPLVLWFWEQNDNNKKLYIEYYILYLLYLFKIDISKRFNDKYFIYYVFLFIINALWILILGKEIMMFFLPFSLFILFILLFYNKWKNKKIWYLIFNIISILFPTIIFLKTLIPFQWKADFTTFNFLPIAIFLIYYALSINYLWIIFSLLKIRKQK